MISHKCQLKKWKFVTALNSDEYSLFDTCYEIYLSTGEEEMSLFLLSILPDEPFRRP